MVRVVAGRARGRRLAVPKGAGVRPTSDKVRGALFDVLVHRFEGVEGLAVMDLFAGAGTLGIEALSRGAASVVFVERDRRHAGVLRDNLAAVEGAVEGQGRLVVRGVEAWLAGGPSGGAGPVDLVLLDPPYAAGRVAATLAALVTGGWLADAALVCVEHPSEEPVAAPVGLEAVFTRSYGGTTVTILQRSSREGASI